MKLRTVIAGVALAAGMAVAQSESYSKSLSCGMDGLRAKDASKAHACLTDALAAAGTSFEKVQALVLLAKADQNEPDLTGEEEHYKAAVAAAVAPADRVPAELLYASFLETQGRPDEAKPIREKAEEHRVQAAAIRARQSEPVPEAFYRTGGGVYKAGNGVTQPVPSYHPEPEYSELARLAGLTGSVLIYIEVDKDGGVIHPRVLKTLGFGLDEKAVEALLRWKFQPGMLNGNPVVVMAQVEVNFRLFAR